MDYDKLISILQAVKNGKTVQWYVSGWEDFTSAKEVETNIAWIASNLSNVRIKPEQIKQPLSFSELCDLVKQKAKIIWPKHNPSGTLCGIIEPVSSKDLDLFVFFTDHTIKCYKLSDLIKHECTVNGKPLYKLVDPQ